MKLTKPQREACQRELERCAGRQWVSLTRIPERAWDAYCAAGWGTNGVETLFAERGLDRVSGHEVALLSALCLVAYA